MVMVVISLGSGRPSVRPSGTTVQCHANRPFCCSHALTALNFTNLFTAIVHVYFCCSGTKAET